MRCAQASSCCLLNIHVKYRSKLQNIYLVFPVNEAYVNKEMA